MFVEGNTKGWQEALNKIVKESEYKTILSGHGKEGGKELLKDKLDYLDFVEKTITQSKNKDEFKSIILKKYPEYGGEQLIDIYLNFYLKPDHWSN